MVQKKGRKLPWRPTQGKLANPYHVFLSIIIESNHHYLSKLFLELSISNFLIVFLFSFFELSASDHGVESHKLNNISKQCENSLEWYDDHPGYSGEFNRVFEYCKKY